MQLLSQETERKKILSTRNDIDERRGRVIEITNSRYRMARGSDEKSATSSPNAGVKKEVPVEHKDK